MQCLAIPNQSQSLNNEIYTPPAYMIHPLACLTFVYAPSLLTCNQSCPVQSWRPCSMHMAPSAWRHPTSHRNWGTFAQKWRKQEAHQWLSSRRSIIAGHGTPPMPRQPHGPQPTLAGRSSTWPNNRQSSTRCQWLISGAGGSSAAQFQKVNHCTMAHSG